MQSVPTADGSHFWEIDLPVEGGEAVWSTTTPVFDAGRQRAYFNARLGTDSSYLYAIDLAPQIAPGDTNADGVIDTVDLLGLLSAWGVCAGCPRTSTAAARSVGCGAFAPARDHPAGAAV